MIIKTLQEVFDQEPALMSIQTVNNGSRLDRLRSYVTGRSKGLTLAGASGHVDEVRTLIRKGAHVDAQNGRGEMAQGLAIMNGHTEVVELLLSSYADVNKAIKEGLTPLQFGVQYARLDVIQLLLEHGANVNQESHHGLPLAMAIHKRDADILRLLLRFQANIEAWSTSTDMMRPTSPLHLAIWLGKVEHVRVLLNAGANTEATYKSWSEQTGANYTLIDPEEASHTALQHAINISSPMEVVDLLLEHHADVNSVTRSGSTSLHMAVMPKVDREGEGDKLLAALLRHGAKIVITDQGSPLHLASESGDEVMAQLLLKHGARFDEPAPLEYRLRVELYPFNCDAFKDRGKTPLWLAAERGHHGMVKMFLRSDTFIAEGRLDSDECVVDCSKHPLGKCLFRGLVACTALQIAVAHGHRKIARMLMDNGANINRHFTYIHGDTTLARRNHLFHAAVARYAPSGVQLLIDLGADTERPDSHGELPLHLAKNNKNNDFFFAVKKLVANGANINARCRNGETLLHDAVRHRINYLPVSLGEELFRLLLKNGIDPNAKNNAGFTPLELAERHKSSGVAMELRQALTKCNWVHDSTLLHWVHY